VLHTQRALTCSQYVLGRYELYHTEVVARTPYSLNSHTHIDLRNLDEGFVRCDGNKDVYFRRAFGRQMYTFYNILSETAATYVSINMNKVGFQRS